VADGALTAGTATILFTDLVGSTELRARLGDGLADELRRVHDQLLAAAVEEQGGTTVKGLGDGILATFGAATDAVAAATAIQRAIERTNRRVDDARRLVVRVGVSAGDVSWEDGDCHGTPVITAARLCDRAVGGQILVDDLVRGLARGRTEHSFRLVGELELKGLAEPVAAYEVPWEPAVGDRAPLPAPLLPVARELPFAGRDAERDALRAQWKAAQTDGRSVALVSGEPGVGKTRLTAELARAAHAEGAWVLAGRCDERISAPFTPWLEVLHHVVAHAPDELLRAHVERHGGELTRLVPELRRRVDDVPEPRRLDVETEQLVLFDAVVDLVDALALDAPVLLVIDDAHWADASSLGLLRHAVRHLPPTSAVLAIVTYRDTDVDRTHPLSAMIGDLRREPRVEDLALRGIDEAGIRALLVAAGGHELDKIEIDFAAMLERETEGNPFFVGEVLRHLIETNVLVQEDGTWRGAVTSIEEIGIPEGVRDVVGRRLSRLSEDANAILRTAAVVGREFPLDLLAEVAGIPEDVTLEHVESAIAARLVDEVQGSPGRLSFSHALVQQTLLEELSTTRRVRIHAAIGAALERRGDATAAELAHHFGEGATTGVADRALEYARRAAREAGDRLAYEDAVHFLDVALEMLEVGDGDARTRAELLVERGWLHHLRGDQDAGRADALVAADLARSIDAPELVASAGIAYRGALGHWASPSDPVGVELMREGLARLPADDLVTRADAMAVLAYSLVLDPGDEALTVAEEAESLARQAGADEALNRALTARGWALRSRGRAEELLRVAGLGVEHALGCGRPDWEWPVRYLLVAGHLELGDVERARVETERAYSVRSSLEGWGPVELAATCAIAEGRFDGVHDTIEAAAELGAALGDTNETIRCGNHIYAHLLQGEFDEALRWAEIANRTVMGAASGNLPWVLAEVGDTVGATAAYETWARDVRPLAPQVLRQWTLAYEAGIALRTGDAALAARVAAELEPFRGHFLAGDTGIFGAAEGALARVAIVERRFDEAVPLAEHALAAVETRGWHALATQQRVDLARARLGRAGAGDAEHARALLAEAIETADALGMAPAGAEARTLLE
jgi:class 3 adenylate cyclase/tetratricopeptide (TPR) repeat protein